MGVKHLPTLPTTIGSRFWKRITSVLPIVLKNSRILIKSGGCNFWFDNWLGDGAISDSHKVKGSENLVVADLLHNYGWDIHKVHDKVPENMVAKILAWSSQIISDNDIYIRQPNLDGNFSTKFAWILIRTQGSVCLWKKWL